MKKESNNRLDLIVIVLLLLFSFVLIKLSEHPYSYFVAIVFFAIALYGIIALYKGKRFIFSAK